MKNYIICSYVQAQPITRGEYNTLKGWTVPENEDENDDGYLVWRGKKHCCWVPKDIFENESFELPENNFSAEVVTEEMIDRFIKSTHAEVFNDKFTYLVCELVNGVSLQTVALCDETYDFAREKEKCMNQIIEQLKNNMEFLVYASLHGFREEKFI